MPENANLKGCIAEVKSTKQSRSTRYGQIFEQLVPFSRNSSFDPKKFIFLGNPIDGVVFEDDRIVFVEIKLSKSNMSQGQKRIKELVEKIRFTLKRSGDNETSGF